MKNQDIKAAFREPKWTWLSLSFSLAGTIFWIWLSIYIYFQGTSRWAAFTFVPFLAMSLSNAAKDTRRLCSRRKSTDQQITPASVAD